MRRRARAKRSYFWLGSQGTIAVSTTNVVQDLYDPSFASLADSKSLRLERIVGWVSFGSITATTSTLAMSVQHVPTSETLADANILDPSLNDADYFNKRQLVWGARFPTPVLGQTQLVIPIDIRSKRRVDAAQDNVVFTWIGNSAVNTTQVVYWLRSLYSKPS